MKITDIRPTKAGRFSIFADGEYALSVDGDTLVMNHLKIGTELDLSQLMDIQTQSELQKAKAKAYHFLSYRDHSETELYNKLTDKFPEEIAAMAVEYFVSIGYVNDETFAQRYLTHLKNKGTLSEKSMMYELRKKGIVEEIIEECFSQEEVDDSETVKALILKKYVRKLGDGDPLLVQKVKQSVARRGFSYDAVSRGMRRALIELGLEEE